MRKTGWARLVAVLWVAWVPWRAWHIDDAMQYTQPWTRDEWLALAVQCIAIPAFAIAAWRWVWAGWSRPARKPYSPADDAMDRRTTALAYAVAFRAERLGIDRERAVNHGISTMFKFVAAKRLGLRPPGPEQMVSDLMAACMLVTSSAEGRKMFDEYTESIAGAPMTAEVSAFTATAEYQQASAL